MKKQFLYLLLTFTLTVFYSCKQNQSNNSEDTTEQPTENEADSTLVETEPIDSTSTEGEDDSTILDIPKFGTFDLSEWVKSEPANNEEGDISSTTTIYTKGNQILHLETIDKGEYGIALRNTLRDKSNNNLKVWELDYSSDVAALTETVEDFATKQKHVRSQALRLTYPWKASDLPNGVEGEWKTESMEKEKAEPTASNEKTTTTTTKPVRTTINKNNMVVQLKSYSSWDEMARSQKALVTNVQKIAWPNQSFTEKDIYAEDVDGKVRVYVVAAGNEINDFLTTVKEVPLFWDAYLQRDYNRRKMMTFDRALEKSSESKNVASASQYKILLGSYTEKKSDEYLATTFGFTNWEKDNFEKLITYDFKNVEGKVYRRYFFGSYDNESIANTKKQELEKRSKKKLSLIKY